MPIREQALGPFGLYKNRLAANRDLLFGKEAGRIREHLRTLSDYHGGDPTIPHALFHAAKSATPHVSQVRKIMDEFGRLYGSLERKGLIGQQAEASMLEGLKDGTTDVTLRFIPVDVTEYRGLSESGGLYMLVNAVIDARPSVWDIRTGDDMMDPAQYTGEGYIELGTIVVRRGQPVPLTEDEMISHVITHEFSDFGRGSVIYNAAAAIPTTRMSYSTSETALYGRMTPVGL